MGLMDKMAGIMMGRISGKEKQELMEGMMDKFFLGMSKQERKEVMSRMMPKMMAEMMGGGGMMEMMKMCCGGGEGEEDFNPMEMCKAMMESISKSSELATYATPEVRALFEDWIEEVSSEILQFIENRGKTTPEEITREMKISLNSAIFFIGHLAREGKLRIESVMTTEGGD